MAKILPLLLCTLLLGCPVAEPSPDREEPCEGDDRDGDGDGLTTCEGDCDDDDPNRFPGNPEICDGIDNGCSGAVPPLEAEADEDQDGWRVCSGDCDDEDETIHPEQDDRCDGRDEDCDGEVDTPVDQDGDGEPGPCVDCDDDDPNRFPGNPEICDGEDNDCDGALPPEEADEDNDGLTERVLRGLRRHRPDHPPGAGGSLRRTRRGLLLRSDPNARLTRLSLQA